MSKVLLYIGDGLGNSAHAMAAIAAARTVCDLTVSVISTNPEAAWLVDHDKIVTGVQDHGAFDRVYASPTLPWLQVNGKRVLPDDVRIPPYSLQEWSEADACFWIARDLGYRGKVPPPAIRQPEPFALDLDGHAEPYVVIAPGFQKGDADSAWKNKAFPRWGNVASALLDNQIKVISVGSASEVEPWMDRADMNLCGKTTLPQFASVLRGASVVIGVDNGATAISAAYGVPTVVLWGPTSMLKNRKDGKRVTNLANPVCQCRPCQFTSRLVECRDNVCMSSIPVASVIRAAVNLLAKEGVVPKAQPAPSHRQTEPGTKPAIVIGCGRSGTNMVLEMLRASGQFNASDAPEDKEVIGRPALPKGYLTKVDTYYFTWSELDAFLEREPDARIVWTWRDPRDMVLSKMRRGVPTELGGDCQGWAGDASPDGCVADIRDAVDIFQRLTASRFADRVRTVKAEDVILKTEETARNLATWLGVDYSPNMLQFPEYVRQPQKRGRYRTIDPGEVAKWKQWQTAYDGWFVKQGIVPTDIWAGLEDVTALLGYEATPQDASDDGFVSAQWQAWDKELEDADLFSLPTNDTMRRMVVMDGDDDFVGCTEPYAAERERILSRFVEHPALDPRASNLATGTWLHKSSEKYLLDACLILRHMPNLKGKRILEIGPAFGGLARMLLMTEPEIEQYVGLGHGKMLMLAREFLKDQGQAVVTNVESLQADADSDFDEFDLVIANADLSETTPAFRRWLAEKVFPKAKAAFIVAGDKQKPEVRQWLDESLHASFAKVETTPYPARPELEQVVFLASR